MPLVWLATEGDAPAVTALLGAFRDWMERDAPSDGSLANSVRRLIAEDETEFLLAAEAEDSAPAGVCQLRYRHGLWLDGEDCWLEDLFVVEDARGSALGRSLVDAALQRARERGCVRIELDASESNPAAVALYERAGFSSWSEFFGGRDLLFRRRL